LPDVGLLRRTHGGAPPGLLDFSSPSNPLDTKHRIGRAESVQSHDSLTSVSFHLILNVSLSALTPVDPDMENLGRQTINRTEGNRRLNND